MDLENIITKITEEVYARISEPPREAPGGNQGVSADRIEYSLLDPRMKIDAIDEACRTAKQKGYACICIPQWFIEHACGLLKGSSVKVCAPVGLPGGAAATAAKYAEVRQAVQNGAQEVDIPMNMELLKQGDLKGVKNDLEEAMVPARGKATVKAVLETGVLSPEQEEKAVALAQECGADYIVLSGILRGAAVEPRDVKRALDAAKGGLKVKAAGGIRDAGQAGALIAAGVHRIGTSSAGKMV
jgi:deoxyribose-phosphate aldolase